MDLEQAFKILKENNIGYRKVNKTVPFGHIISESGLNRLRSNLENGGIIISGDKSDHELELEIKNSRYSYSRVYGVNDSYEPSFIVYCKDRNGELNDFEDLFDFGVKLCKKNNSRRFTSDIKFESLMVKRLSNFERMKARQYGEIVLD